MSIVSLVRRLLGRTPPPAPHPAWSLDVGGEPLEPSDATAVDVAVMLGIQPSTPSAFGMCVYPTSEQTGSEDGNR